MELDSSARSSSTDNRQYKAVICASCLMFFFFAVIFALLFDSGHSKDDHSLSCPLSNVDCTALFKSKARNCCKTLCLPLLSKCVFTSYSMPLIFIRKLFPCSVHNSFMLHLIVPVRAPLKFPIMFTCLDHIIFGFRCVQSLRKNRLQAFGRDFHDLLLIWLFFGQNLLNVQ